MRLCLWLTEKANDVSQSEREEFILRSRKRATLYFYRFARLEAGQTRLASELPLGFRWVFKTDPHFFSALMWEAERVQNHTQTVLGQSLFLHARFCELTSGTFSR